MLRFATVDLCSWTLSLVYVYVYLYVYGMYVCVCVCVSHSSELQSIIQRSHMK